MQTGKTAVRAAFPGVRTAILVGDHALSDRLLGYVLGILGLLLLASAVHQAVADFRGFASLRSLRDILLPPIFSIAFLPFIYGMALYMKYENVFRRIDLFSGEDPNLARYAKWKMFTSFHINMKGLNEWLKEGRSLHVKNRSDVQALMQRPRSM